MKYYIVVKNSSGDNLAVFEQFEDAVKYCEKNSATLISTYRIQLMPRNGL
jgi:hypothetical protein